MLEDSLALCDEMREYLEYEEEVRKELFSSDPMSAGTQIRVRVMESDAVLILGLRYIVKKQLWEQQVDQNGFKLPTYSPSTIAKKRKIAGYPSDKLINYTEYWTGRFYNEGIRIEADGAKNEWRFVNTYAYDYFHYIDAVDIFGLTPENYASFTAEVGDIVNDAFYEYYKERMSERGYDMFY